MSLIVCILSAVAGVVVFIFIVGMLLSSERSATRRSVLHAEPETVFGIVTDNTQWKYRASIKNLVILENSENGEIWEETATNGKKIRFRMREKTPFSRYSFDMESKLFSGVWSATFIGTGRGETLFTATENIRIKNPFIRALSYLFFDLDKLMEAYQNDLKAELERRASDASSN